MKRILIGILLLLILGIIILKVLSNSYNDLTRPDEPMGIDSLYCFIILKIFIII